MKKKLITLDEETFNLLSKYPNASEVVRDALRVYIQHISLENLAKMDVAWKANVSAIKKLSTQYEERTAELNEQLYTLYEELEKLKERITPGSWT